LSKDVKGTGVRTNYTRSESLSKEGKPRDHVDKARPGQRRIKKIARVMVPKFA